MGDWVWLYELKDWQWYALIAVTVATVAGIVLIARKIREM